jgi:hypothetical protein
MPDRVLGELDTPENLAAGEGCRQLAEHIFGASSLGECCWHRHYKKHDSCEGMNLNRNPREIHFETPSKKHLEGFDEFGLS